MSPLSPMSRMSSFACQVHFCCLCVLLFSTSAFAATTVELSAEASRPAANDLMRTSVVAEASAANAGEVAREVNRLIAEALKTAQLYASVKTRSGGSNTTPVYAAKGGKIEAWRMRSELVLESGDAAALSELLGRLQTRLALSSLSLLPAPETRRSAENAATIEAIAAFKARAQLIAEALGQRYTIKQMTIGGGDRPPSVPMMRAFATQGVEAVPMPIEAGESRVSVQVSGQIVVGD